MALRYPTIVEMVSIGKSAEGREIYAMCLKKRGTKYKVIVEGGIHGNEWIAVEFVTYLVDQLITGNDTRNWRLQELGKKYDWYIIPVLNPDGYVYSQKSVSVLKLLFVKWKSLSNRDLIEVEEDFINL